MDKREGDIFWVEEPSEETPFAIKTKRKSRLQKMEFIGWGSKPLIEFLEANGKDSAEELSQYEVAAIINDYVQRNRLLHPVKKKKILCDERLHSLFGKKSVPRIKIYDLLEAHFAENHDSSEDDRLHSSEGEDEDFCKVGKASVSLKNNQPKKPAPRAPRSCFAAIIPENIKLAYLKGSLIQDLLAKHPETFGDKVVGSYVRIKSDPNDYFQKNSHHLLPVSGVRKTPGNDNDGEEVFLNVSNMKMDIPLHKLSDDDFSKEECEELCQRVKEGLLKKPTVVELERKAQNLHEDITKHWLPRELAYLQNLIDRANEKGWRRELFEYLERRQLLQTPSEQSRLLQDVPKVIAEEVEIKPASQDNVETEKENDKQGNSSSPTSTIRDAKELLQLPFEQSRLMQNVPKAIAEKLELKPTSQDNMEHKERNGKQRNSFSPTSTLGDASTLFADSIANQTLLSCPSDMAGTKGTAIPSQEELKDSPIAGKCCFIDFITGTKSVNGQDENQAVDIAPSEEKPSLQPKQGSNAEARAVNSGENEGIKGIPANQVSQVIELSDDDEDEEEAKVVAKMQIGNHPESVMWYYFDPQGQIQGPFSMTSLKRWNEAFYFHPTFKVWKKGQTPEHAVLLIDMLRQVFPPM